MLLHVFKDRFVFLLFLQASMCAKGLTHGFWVFFNSSFYLDYISRRPPPPPFTTYTLSVIWRFCLNPVFINYFRFLTFSPSGAITYFMLRTSNYAGSLVAWICAWVLRFNWLVLGFSFICDIFESFLGCSHGFSDNSIRYC